MRRLLALDYGRRRIGVAASDPLGLTAQPLCAIELGRDAAFAEIVRICEEREVERIVVGLPLRMDGSEGDMAKEVRAFAIEVERRAGRPVDLIDERLTSHAAEEALKGTKRRRQHREQGRIDAMAAAQILRDYMDTHGEK